MLNYPTQKNEAGHLTMKVIWCRWFRRKERLIFTKYDLNVVPPYASKVVYLMPGSCMPHD
ncbi:hypothetical protein Pure05_38910 [Paenarthrobacter ureafaciens]|nr:hypothetical protein Pure01_38930 [Paenarthrobacter ureafaciens]GLU65674.1 hypothetical protein Pure02_39240 [Paenarthrobacter ureafaciens]GLU69987.1 hypothetical protein Pure03_39630 [Paenarthrobacter ureafaciens]GLU74234.1 hypothetical protein Pure04_39490 [Paenarthrobacter ureafaciens]GLU78451.1 hypothetical protein Pure05_38910 [Paenarthrobacter ureafaciens]